MNSFTNRPNNIQVSKPKEVKFRAVLIVFVMGALSLATAMAYNNFAKDVINHFSFGDHLWGSLINLVVFTIFTVLILRFLWEKYPEEVDDVVD